MVSSTKPAVGHRFSASARRMLKNESSGVGCMVKLPGQGALISRRTPLYGVSQHPPRPILRELLALTGLHGLR